MQLIFLHAFPLDSRMWNAQLNILPDRIITPDLYRFGDSLESWARGVLETVEGDNLVLAGASIGGSCALEMARQAGHRIAGLVLVGAKAGHHPEPDLRDKQITELTHHGIKGLWREILSQCFDARPDPKIIDQVRSISNDQRTEDLIRAIKVFHSRPDLTHVVKQWPKPLLAISGTCGKLETADKSAALAAAAPFGKAHAMHGCGHYMNMERPDEFNEAIRRFLHWVNQPSFR